MTVKKDEETFQELLKKEFPVLPSTFDNIVDLLKEDMEWQDTNLCRCIRV